MHAYMLIYVRLLELLTNSSIDVYIQIIMTDVLQLDYTNQSVDIIKGKDAVVLQMELRLISLSQAIEPVGGYTTACHAWPVRRQTCGYLPSQWPVPIYTAW